MDNSIADPFTIFGAKGVAAHTTFKENSRNGERWVTTSMILIVSPYEQYFDTLTKSKKNDKK